MIATMSQQAPAMVLPVSHPSAAKRPKLSLQIKSSPTTTLTPGMAPKDEIDPMSATAFNTLSSAYAAAIELSSPKVTIPPASLDSANPINVARKSGLRLVTNATSVKNVIFPSQHTQTPGPINVAYPDTPAAVYVGMSPITAYPRADIPSFTFTPPQSAQPSDEIKPQVFSFTNRHSDDVAAMSRRTLRRRATTGTQHLTPPYTHPRSLRSILRNSPLPPRSALTPMSPTRSSRRLADRAAKKLCFNNPLTQTITTERYIRSHIDLLVEEASPHSATDAEVEGLGTLDLTMAYSGDETRDGGQTPGPFEEMRRRMAGLGAESDTETPGVKKRKRKEKKRRWVWTIGVNEDEIEDKQPSSLTSSISESAENSSSVENTVAKTQVEDLKHTANIAIEIPSEISAEGLNDAVPVTAIPFPSEDMGNPPITAIELWSRFPKISLAAVRQWAEVHKNCSITMKIEEVAEYLATSTGAKDSMDETEMVDETEASHDV